MKNPVIQMLVANAILIMVLIYSTTAATASTIRTLDSNTISFEGTVEEGDSKRLKSAMEASGANTVYLNSNGGAAAEGFRIGILLRDKNATAVVKDGDVCLSACAVALLGAPNLQMDGILGFHVAWSPSAGTHNEGLKSGQLIGTLTSNYMFTMGYTYQLMYIVSTITDAKTFLILDQDDLKLFRMVDGQYSKSVELPDLWLYERVADPLRLSLLKKGY